MSSVIQGFKEFLLRGNVVDLAVAVVIGAAFGAVATAMVESFITPLIAAIGGQPDFSALTFTLNESQFRYGDFFNALISFLMIAAVIYFVVVVPMNRILERTQKGPPPEPDTKQCPECLSEIPIAARRCAFCTALVEPPAAETQAATDAKVAPATS